MSSQLRTSASHSKYLYAGVGLLVAGVLFQALAPPLFVELSGGVNGEQSALTRMLDPFVTLCRWVFMPLGSSLTAASFVIKELSSVSAGTRISQRATSGRSVQDGGVTTDALPPP